MSRRQRTDDPAALALIDHLRDVTGEIARCDTERSRLMDDRNATFVQLKDFGVTNREIAEAADITEMAVKKAIDKTRRQAA